MKQTEFGPEVLEQANGRVEKILHGEEPVSRREALIEAIQPNIAKLEEIVNGKPSRRSECSKKAWDTRRKKGEAKQEPSVDASALRALIQRVFEKREEVAEAQDTLACMEAELDTFINRITYSKP